MCMRALHCTWLLWSEDFQSIWIIHHIILYFIQFTMKIACEFNHNL